MTTTTDPRVEFGPVTPAGGLFVRDLRANDAIVVPTEFGTVSLPVVVVSVDGEPGDERTLRYRTADGVEDYLFCEDDEVFPLGEVVERIDAADLQVGDVVTYANANGTACASPVVSLGAVDKYPHLLGILLARDVELLHPFSQQVEVVR